MGQGSSLYEQQAFVKSIIFKPNYLKPPLGEKTTIK